MLKSPFPNAAGKRNTPITIERATNAPSNGVGEVLPQWSTYGSTYAEAITTSGREFTAAMSVEAMLQAIYRLPYNSMTSRITPRMRVRINGCGCEERVLNISAVFNEREANETIVLWLVEEVEV